MDMLKPRMGAVRRKAAATAESVVKSAEKIKEDENGVSLNLQDLSIVVPENSYLHP